MQTVDGPDMKTVGGVVLVDSATVAVWLQLLPSLTLTVWIPGGTVEITVGVTPDGDQE